MNSFSECVVGNRVDVDGNPAGGTVDGIGLHIQWQDGPLGRGEDRKKPNGAFVETVINAAMSRIEFYQASKFKSEENEKAINALRVALDALNMRTKRREAAETEGTHKV